MALGDNLIGLAVGKVQAENRGLQPPESTRIGVISALMPNPIMSFVISRSLADKEVEALQPPPPPPTGGDTGGTGAHPQTDFERRLQRQVDTLSRKVDAMQATLTEIEKKLSLPAGEGEPKGRNRGGG